MMTDLQGGYYEHLRTQDALGRCTCHYIATEKGIMYEASGRVSGLYDPDTHTGVEYDIGLRGSVHTGCDPEARLWFYEGHDHAREIHSIFFFECLTPGKPGRPIPLIGNMKTYWLGQRSHLHPQIMPDRQSILITGGDPGNETNHLFLMDIADLKDTELEFPP